MCFLCNSPAVVMYIAYMTANSSHIKLVTGSLLLVCDSITMCSHLRLDSIILQYKYPLVFFCFTQSAAVDQLSVFHFLWVLFFLIWWPGLSPDLTLLAALDTVRILSASSCLISAHPQLKRLSNVAPIDFFSFCTPHDFTFGC